MVVQVFVGPKSEPIEFRIHSVSVSVVELVTVVSCALRFSRQGKLYCPDVNVRNRESIEIRHLFSLEMVLNIHKNRDL